MKQGDGITVMRRKLHKPRKTRADYPRIAYTQHSIIAALTEKLGRRERFYDRVDCSGGPDSCWPWRGQRIKTGYGLFQGATNYVGFSFLAHRVAWTIAHGIEPPEGVVIRHTCDNPACCNPSHLLSGTHYDNMQDMIERGRAPAPAGLGKLGAKANAARYSQEQRDEAIRLRFHERRSIAEIAAIIGCQRHTVMRWLAEYAPKRKKNRRDDASES